MKFENKEVEKMYYDVHRKYNINSVRDNSKVVTYEDILNIEEYFKNFDDIFNDKI
ncbi:hypothetical protein [Clostridium gasigenes]|uniref:Uncharacterized protein n=1 Tax=Clostridium gasigenes TaxID=94869 RepID=A0A1H0M535_9CLOT|nr:hypothetical protein [Clostridium gasigenes]SDO75411.1 hypothetical protein SAMN04488529_101321 [Clostridium gasigenes]